MNLNPQRKIGESHADYRIRRAAENEAVTAYLRGPKITVLGHLGPLVVRRKPISTSPSRHAGVRTRQGHKAAKAARSLLKEL